MGIRDWFSLTRVPQISADDLNKRLENPSHELFLLDVRTVTEWKHSHICESHSIPVQTVDVAQLPNDKTIICICRSAHRSTPVARQLLRHGFEVYELEGGMRAWWKKQYPTLKQ